MEVPSDEVCIDARFFDTTKHKPLKEGRAKTEEYVGGGRTPKCSFLRESSTRGSGGNAPSPTEQLRTLRVSLAETAYRKWNF